MALPQLQQVDMVAPLQAYYAGQQQQRRNALTDRQLKIQEMKLQEYQQQAPIRALQEKLAKIDADEKLVAFGRQRLAALDTESPDFDQQAVSMVRDYQNLLVQHYDFTQQEADIIGEQLITLGATSRQGVTAIKQKLGLLGEQKTQIVDGQLVTIGPDGATASPITGFQQQPDEPATTLGKLIAERNNLSANSQERALYDQAIQKEVSKSGETIEMTPDGGLRIVRGSASGQAKAPSGFQWSADGKTLEPIPGGPEATKQEEIEGKKQQKIVNTLTKFDVVSTSVDEALASVDNMTAGLVGSVAKQIPGTPAYNLKETIATIQANIGFDTLQGMREASPTGGALGQTSERELSLLISTLGSLDQNQSPAQLRRNLRKIKMHYENWKDAVMEASQVNEVGKPERSGISTAEDFFKQKGN